MKVSVPNFIGARLEQARLSRGMFKKTLGDLIGVTGEQINRYEKGINKPHPDKLDLLAKHLGFLPEFFLMPIIHEEIGPVFWRSNSSESKSAREMSEQRMKWLAELFSFLEEDINFPEYIDYTDLVKKDFRLLTPEDIEDIALEVRMNMGFRELPIPDATLAMENIGIPVVHLEIPSDKQDAFHYRPKNFDRAFIGINTYNITAVRARFDIAHEFGHAVLHSKVTRDDLKNPSFFKIIEMQANRFAGAFLFPKSSFIKEVQFPSLDYFCSLKKRWGLSIAAMIYRSFDLGLIGKSEKTTLYKNMSRRGWRGEKREPFDDPEVMKLEKPRMLRRATELMVNQGPYTNSGLSQTLALPNEILEEITGVFAGFFNEAEIVEFPNMNERDSFQITDMETGNILTFPNKK